MPNASLEVGPTSLLTPEGPASASITPSRRAILPLMGVGGYALAADSATAKTISTPGDGLIIDEVTYPSAGFDLPAYVARPEKAGRHAVVLVVSEIFGLHAYIADVCRRLARLGYVAVAPAFFARAGDPSGMSDWDQIRAIVATATNDQVMGDVGATIAWLSNQPFADLDRMGITGYCWGGAVTWMAVAEYEAIGAGVAWYGRLRGRPDAEEQRLWPIDIAADLKAPVLGLYASDDRGIPQADVDAMNAALKAAGGQSTIKVFPNTRHGFHADYREQYAPAAAHTGWAHLQSWFRRHGVAV